MRYDLRAPRRCNAGGLAAQMRTVTRVGVVAKPRSYSGPCPVTLQFIGGRMQVWERLHVLAPTGISSPMARVNVRCR